jgi:hypothetical protein
MSMASLLTLQAIIRVTLWTLRSMLSAKIVMSKVKADERSRISAERSYFRRLLDRLLRH